MVRFLLSWDDVPSSAAAVQDFEHRRADAAEAPGLRLHIAASSRLIMCAACCGLTSTEPAKSRSDPVQLSRLTAVSEGSGLLASNLHLSMKLASSRDDLTRRALLRVAELHRAGDLILRTHTDAMLDIAKDAAAGMLTLAQEDYVRSILTDQRHAPRVARIVAELEGRVAYAAPAPTLTATAPASPMAAAHPPPTPRRKPSRSAQLAFGFDPPGRVSRRKPVTARPEDGDLYDAVLRLRRTGRRVFRCGALHKVDGLLLTSAQLQALDAALKRVGTGVASFPAGGSLPS